MAVSSAGAGTIGPLARFSINDHGEDGTPDEIRGGSSNSLSIAIQRDFIPPVVPPGSPRPSPATEGRVSGFLVYSLSSIQSVLSAELVLTENGAQGPRNINLSYAVASIPGMGPPSGGLRTLPGDSVWDEAFGLTYILDTTFRTPGNSNGRVSVVDVTNPLIAALSDRSEGDLLFLRLDMEREIAALPDQNGADFGINFRQQPIRYTPGPDPSVVPLPAGILLLLSGVLGIAMVRLRV